MLGSHFPQVRGLWEQVEASPSPPTRVEGMPTWSWESIGLQSQSHYVRLVLAVRWNYAYRSSAGCGLENFVRPVFDLTNGYAPDNIYGNDSGSPC
ncbi:hypothetical protein F4678DRAFT_431825 [Xylaria arbuscula]|nr:hypothetical protein F4678DRAFT_431825 [Xylaria arbuscula]